MTTTLILSDIHANPWALDAVIADAHKYFSVSEVWFLGDLFGYGPDPYKVWNKLCKNPFLPLVQIAGNHDWGVIHRIEGSKILNDINGEAGVWISHYRLDASRVIDAHQRLLGKKEQVLKNLSGLPVSISPRRGVYLAHGEISDNPEKSIKHYTIQPVSSPLELVAKFLDGSRSFPRQIILPDGYSDAAPLIFVNGHTHCQRLWFWDSERNEWINQPINKPYSLNGLEQAPIMFNPGSVGFSRDPSGCPSYAMINWDKEALSFHHVWYDTKLLREKMATEPYIGLISDNRFFIEPNCQENL